jgi:hypothetical protein
VRAWVQASLPADISHKVHNALRLSRDDISAGQKFLARKAGSAMAGRANSAVRAGTPCKNICLKKNVPWQAHRV